MPGRGAPLDVPGIAAIAAARAISAFLIAQASRSQAKKSKQIRTGSGATPQAHFQHVLFMF
jgi:hypothetical protein